MKKYILAIDQGTTSSRALLFDEAFTIKGLGQEEFTQHFPNSGWVEHDPQDIWRTTLNTCHAAIKSADIKSDQILSIGITNQRETTLIWNKETGEMLHNAIVWQDRRTADYCNTLREQSFEELIINKTGLLLDPYFSATKIVWILENVKGARALAEQGKLAFGTVDCYLIWKLTGGKIHATDATNASRTMLYNIHTGQWDDELLKLFNIPKNLLPVVMDCSADFGITDKQLFNTQIPINGVAGDQHAAVIGQACFKPGMVKCTYGTGAFAVLNTGSKVVKSSNKLLSTIAYQFEGKPTYALEGSIFIAGSAVQWLRDGLGIIESAEQTQTLAEAADPTQEIYLVPAFTGLGAPYWDPEARGALYGITRNTGPNEITKATLESVAYQTQDLLTAMQNDWQSEQGITALRVDGGMSTSDWVMQCIANTIQTTVVKPQVTETTALGAAYLAGKFSGFFPDLEQFSSIWQAQKSYSPNTSKALSDLKYKGWKNCINRTLVKKT